jgi:two-component system, chemotaxis family, protein-glutamate methylesterase/glutaminase
MSDTRGERFRLVAVGASAGGLGALRELVAGLPPEFDVPVVIVQHRARESQLLCELLQECSPLRVQEVVDKLVVEPGVFVAPPDYHLLLDDGSFSLSVDEPVRYSRPSIDVMFESASDEYGSATIGVVLTGANADGAAGLSRIVERGGHAIVQDPETAEVKVMPRSALKAVPDAEVLPVERIGRRLVELAAGRDHPRTRGVA